MNVHISGNKIHTIELFVLIQRFINWSWLWYWGVNLSCFQGKEISTIIFTSAFRKDSKRIQRKTSTSMHVLKILCRRQSWYTVVIGRLIHLPVKLPLLQDQLDRNCSMENATLQQKPKGFCKTFAEMSRCSNIEQSVLRCIGVKFMVFIPSGYMYMYRFSRRLFFKTKYCKQTI